MPVWPLARLGSDAIIASIGTQTTTFDIVPGVRLQGLFEPLLGVRILDRHKQFDPSQQVAGHPVGAGDEHQFLAAGQEIEDARMFQIPVQNTDDADVLADARARRAAGSRLPRTLSWIFTPRAMRDTAR